MQPMFLPVAKSLLSISNLNRGQQVCDSDNETILIINQTETTIVPEIVAEHYDTFYTDMTSH